jgi:hypothetical protein
MSNVAPRHQADPFLNQRLQAVSETDSSFYIRMEDELWLSAWTTTAGLTITLNGILVDLHGDAKPFNLVLTPTSDGVRTNVKARIGPGFVLYCYPTLSGGTPAAGNTTVAVEIHQSDSATGPIVRQVMFGTLTAQGLIEYRQATASAVSNLPTPTVISIANPAPGAEFTITVPASVIWDVKSIIYTYTADANAASRDLRLHINDGTTDLYWYKADTGLVATKIDYIVLSNGLVAQAQTLSSLEFLVYGQLPQLLLPAGYKIISDTANKQAGDQYSEIKVMAQVYAA